MDQNVLSLQENIQQIYNKFEQLQFIYNKLNYSDNISVIKDWFDSEYRDMMDLLNDGENLIINCKDSLFESDKINEQLMIRELSWPYSNLRNSFIIMSIDLRELEPSMSIDTSNLQKYAINDKVESAKNIFNKLNNIITHLKENERPHAYSHHKNLFQKTYSAVEYTISRCFPPGYKSAWPYTERHIDRDIEEIHSNILKMNAFRNDIVFADSNNSDLYNQHYLKALNIIHSIKKTLDYKHFSLGDKFKGIRLPLSVLNKHLKILDKIIDIECKDLKKGISQKSSFEDLLTNAKTFDNLIGNTKSFDDMLNNAKQRQQEQFLNRTSSELSNHRNYDYNIREK